MKTVALRSLGCKVNAYETEGMQQILEQNGYLIVPFDKKADIYIVNTCSVTNIADQKSRQMLHRAKKLNPDAVVVAAGCYVQTGYEKLLSDKAVDIIVGNNEKKNISEILHDYFDSIDGEQICNEADLENTDRMKYVPDMNAGLDYEEMKVSGLAEHTRGFIKIEDGCNRFCTYCVIPYARGRVRSRLIKDIVEEAKTLAAKDCKEIVITGINISSFGADRGYTGGEELIDLLRELNNVDGIQRIRIGSLDPWIISESFAQSLAEIEKLCPHFHLSMQSGSDGVLTRMNRRYTSAEYYEKVEILRRIFEKPAITTDVIVGFPGETEEEFEETFDFVKKVNFYEMHVFKYSKRDGTIAASMPDQVPEQIKAARSERLIDLGEEMSIAFRKEYIGRDTTVLFEETKTIDGARYWVGYTPEYIMTATLADSENDNMENTIVKGILDDFLTDNQLRLLV